MSDAVCSFVWGDNNAPIDIFPLAAIRALNVQEGLQGLSCTEVQLDDGGVKRLVLLPLPINLVRDRLQLYGNTSSTTYVYANDKDDGSTAVNSVSLPEANWAELGCPNMGRLMENFGVDPNTREELMSECDPQATKKVRALFERNRTGWLASLSLAQPTPPVARTQRCSLPTPEA